MTAFSDIFRAVFTPRRFRFGIAIVAMLLMPLMLAGTLVVAQTGTDSRELRERLERRFDVVPLTGGVALRPKAALGDIRLIEIADGTIAVNGTPVTGRELRDRIGSDADAVLRVSYLTVDQQRALFVAPSATDRNGRSRARDTEPQLERTEPATTTATPTTKEKERAASAPAKGRGEQAATPPKRPLRRSQGDRVRIFGDVTVAEDEEVTGQVVAVMGSVDLGPDAVVGGDVVSVGGRVRRSPTAQVRNVTEVSISDQNVHVKLPWFDGGGPWPFFVSFGALPRLIGSGVRLMLLLLLTGMAFLVARGGVESSAQRVSDNPLKMTMVGLLAEVLLAPVLLLVAFVLAVSIIGIPLLLLIPFVLVMLLLMALVGFAGTAAAIGNSVQRRLTHDGTSPFISVAIGVLVILSPVLAGRIVALAGWPATPVAVVLIALGFSLELLAWASGFGAVLTNAFTRWQGRRAARA